MQIPPEIWTQLRLITAPLPEGIGLSITLHTDGIREWAFETKFSKKVLLPTSACLPTLQSNGRVGIGR